MQYNVSRVINVVGYLVTAFLASLTQIIIQNFEVSFTSHVIIDLLVDEMVSGQHFLNVQYQSRGSAIVITSMLYAYSVRPAPASTYSRGGRPKLVVHRYI